MLGGNSLYERYRQNSTNNTGNSLSSSRTNGNFNQGPQREILGSYRVPDYKEDGGPSPFLKEYTVIWKEYTPSSIAIKDQTLHLSVTELRVEDYFMIRTNKLQPKQA
jgi:hypothetical protein